MYLKYYQDYTGYVLEILLILHMICTAMTTKTTPDIDLKYSKHYTRYLLEILPTLHQICTRKTSNITPYVYLK